MPQPKPETPGPLPSPASRKLELLADAIAATSRFDASLASLREHLAHRGAAGPIGARVMACLLELSVVQQKLCQLQIVALSEEADAHDSPIPDHPGGHPRSNRRGAL